MIDFTGITKSEVRKKVLRYFFTHTEANLYLREIAAILKVDPGNLSKELSRLGKEGVFKSAERGKQKYFSLNERYPLFSELKSIIFKSVGVEGTLKEMLRNIKSIRCAFIYGSYAKGSEKPSSDIDLVVIIDKDKFKAGVFEKKMYELGTKLSREINYSYYPVDEWHDKIKKDSSFIKNILKQDKIMLVGDINGLQ
ncbi:MAG: nucleotidyltransferase domain-containing protein [Candidatus Omnitrophica bacterium]|nr:nucleotidyltransferase domain-containing protein [Candidatus Omnitrophota bacterium]MBU4488363.1 nucleotidyltransferase domain-containing protein [Candidatus Omnitrophota bacterium]MCG2704875.1 nucleotidyltransferase domain-containing protein [Candidatus Omnitrophota bacterium]